jgi:replicative DNA helicase
MSSNVYEFAEGFQLKILAVMSREPASFVAFREVFQPRFFKKDVHIETARMIIDHYEREMERSRVKGTEIAAPTIEIFFEEIRKLTKKNKKKYELRDQYHDAIVDIMDADLTDSEYVKENMVKFGREQAMKLAILESADDLEKGDEDYTKIEDRVAEAMRIGEDMSDLGTDYFEDAESRAEDYEKGTDGVKRIPTGMSGLDQVMNGGLGAGELGIVIAPPNRGKSFALINIGAGAVLEGYNVVHYTLEMPERQVANRYDNRMTKKDFGYLKENTSAFLKSMESIQKHMKGKLVIKKYASNMCNINTIRSHLTRLKMEKNFVPDLIVIDYGDLVQPRRTYADKRFELESVYLDLRDLGEEYQCPVWSASQANRGALDKKVITIGDLAEAFNKANIADFMAALCQTVDEKESGEMRWHIAKQRQGEANITLDGDVDYPTATMTVYPRD